MNSDYLRLAKRISANKTLIDTDIAALTAYIDAAIIAAKLADNPVGTILTNVSGTNPSTYIGGTWVAFGAGRVPVGIDGADPDFDTAEETRGSKTHTLTSAESGVPAHAHPQITMYEWKHDFVNGTQRLTYSRNDTANNGQRNVSVTANTAADASSAHNNIQPSIVVYMWKRTV